jgi:Cu(I)/Ag(I) efflux system membrane protein CusA/SilA
MIKKHLEESSSGLLKAARKTHKWLMLFLGIQFVTWSVTGAYMVFFNIDYIHGDSLIHNHQIKLVDAKVNISIQTLLKQYPEAKKVQLENFIRQPVYRFVVGNDNVLVSANSGALLSPISKDDAVAMAQFEYTGEGDISHVELITENPPFELRARALPAWRINFDDFGSPTLYVSATSGKIVGKRHEFWRLFDWIFRFHVMDYQDSEVDNILLFCFSLLGLFAGLSGLILLYYRLLHSRLFGKNESKINSNDSGSGSTLNRSAQ